MRMNDNCVFTRQGENIYWKFEVNSALKYLHENLINCRILSTFNILELFLFPHFFIWKILREWNPINNLQQYPINIFTERIDKKVKQLEYPHKTPKAGVKLCNTFIAFLSHLSTTFVTPQNPNHIQILQNRLRYCETFLVFSILLKNSGEKHSKCRKNT